MVLMLFDLKKRATGFYKRFLSGILKIFSAALCMIISVSAYMSIDMLGSPSQPEVITTKVSLRSSLPITLLPLKFWVLFC